MEAYGGGGGGEGRKRGRVKDGEEREPEAKRRMAALTPWSAAASAHPHPASRIYRVSRASGGKDRHSKVYTAKGIRDRRVRLSVATAIQFYDLQDRLGYDQPSKAIEWLIKAAADAIDKLPELDAAAGFPAHPASSNKDHATAAAAADQQGADDQALLLEQGNHQQLATRSGCSSTSETSKGSVLSLSRSESRVKARERARERSAAAKDKDTRRRRGLHRPPRRRRGGHHRLLHRAAHGDGRRRGERPRRRRREQAAAAAAGRLLAADGRRRDDRRLHRLRAAAAAESRWRARRGGGARLRLPRSPPHVGAGAALRRRHRRGRRRRRGDDALLLPAGPLHACPRGAGVGSRRRLQPQLLHVLGSCGRQQQQGDPSVQFAHLRPPPPAPAAPEAVVYSGTGGSKHTLPVQPGSRRRGRHPVRRVPALERLPPRGHEGEGEELIINSCEMQCFFSWMGVKTSNNCNSFLGEPSIA